MRSSLALRMTIGIQTAESAVSSDGSRFCRSVVEEPSDVPNPYPSGPQPPPRVPAGGSNPLLYVLCWLSTRSAHVQHLTGFRTSVEAATDARSGVGGPLPCRLRWRPEDTALPLNGDARIPPVETQGSRRAGSLSPPSPSGLWSVRRCSCWLRRWARSGSGFLGTCRRQVIPASSRAAARRWSGVMPTRVVAFAGKRAYLSGTTVAASKLSGECRLGPPRDRVGA